MFVSSVICLVMQKEENIFNFEELMKKLFKGADNAKI